MLRSFVEKIERVFAEKIEKGLSSLIAPPNKKPDEELISYYNNNNINDQNQHQEVEIITTTTTNNNNSVVFVPDDDDVVSKGYFAVVAIKDGEIKRFVVELDYLTNPAFLGLLDQAGEEYGFKQQGTLAVPCRPQELQKILDGWRVLPDTIKGAAPGRDIYFPKFL